MLARELVHVSLEMAWKSPPTKICSHIPGSVPLQKRNHLAGAEGRTGSPTKTKLQQGPQSSVSHKDSVIQEMLPNAANLKKIAKHLTKVGFELDKVRQLGQKSVLTQR